MIALTSPPLRDRRGDVPLLADHFLAHYCDKNGKALMALDRAALDKLVAYDWPGNVRELENVIERAVVLARGTEILRSDLPTSVVEAQPNGDSLAFPIGTPLAEIERRVIYRTLEHTRGDKQLAAQLLGISARTIYRKVGSERDIEENDDLVVVAS